jgi:hypothetical protein
MSEYVPTITFEEAQATQFQSSTKAELHYYYEQHTGKKLHPQTGGPVAREKLLKVLGIVNEFSGAKVGVYKAGQEPIFPDYNLMPNGKWGGRRHRIKVSKPSDATKNENIWVGSWNGSAPYFIRYGEVQAVPEPIYLRIKSLQRPVPTSQSTDMPDGSVEITTVLHLDDRHAVSWLGVDPDTKDHAGSLTEWYQQKGPDWFRKRTERDCQLIAAKLELKWQDDDKRPLPHADILARLVEFIFGFADAVDEAA